MIPACHCTTDAVTPSVKGKGIWSDAAWFRMRTRYSIVIIITNSCLHKQPPCRRGPKCRQTNTLWHPVQKHCVSCFATDTRHVPRAHSTAHLISPLHNLPLAWCIQRLREVGSRQLRQLQIRGKRVAVAAGLENSRASLPLQPCKPSGAGIC